MIPEGTRRHESRRGNSGVKLMERYEVQILDSYDNRTYADGQAHRSTDITRHSSTQPEPSQWQAYDIYFEAPVFENEKFGGSTSYHRHPQRDTRPPSSPIARSHRPANADQRNHSTGSPHHAAGSWQ